MGSQEQNLEAETLCRGCMLNIESRSISFIKNTDLIEKYVACTSIEVNFADGLSLNLCEKCCKLINDFFDFRKMCIESYQKMRDSLSTITDNNYSSEIKDLLKNEPTECKVEIQEFNTEFISKESEDVDEDTDDEKADFLPKFDESSEAESSKSYEEQKSKKTSLSKTSDDKKSNNVLVCNLCSKRFYQKLRYEGHMRQHEGLKPFVCEICNAELADYRGFQRHKKSAHGNLKRVTCTVSGCDKTYKTSDALRLHIKKFHKGLKPTPFICELCGKVLSKRSTLKVHMNSHAGIRPFSCSQCPKSFLTKGKLKVHVMRHDGIKNFICPKCGIKKISNSELKKHLEFHNQEKIFKCEFCSSTFSKIIYLKRHTNVVHKKIKKYQCKYCNLAFGKADTLKHHMMRHTGEKPEECKVCGKRFIQVVALRAHMKIHAKSKNK